MKRQIRKSMFETNSSSMHSIVVTNHDHMLTEDEYKNESWNGVLRWDQLSLTTTHKLHLREKDLTFEGGPQILCTIQEKCAYAIASHAIWNWEMTDFLDELTDVIKEICPEFAGFEFEEQDYREEDNPEKVYYKYGGIDHQSHGLLQNMLIEEGISLRDFILNTRYYVIVDWEDDDVFKKLTSFQIIDKKDIVRRYLGDNDDAILRTYNEPDPFIPGDVKTNDVVYGQVYKGSEELCELTVRFVRNGYVYTDEPKNKFGEAIRYGEANTGDPYLANLSVCHGKDVLSAKYYGGCFRIFKDKDTAITCIKEDSDIS